MIIPNLTRFRRTLVAGVFASLLALAAFAAEAARSFNLPAGEAAQTLKQFAAQAQREIVFSADAVGRVHTNAVSGSLAPKEALDRLLADTGLVATTDAKSGAIAIKSAPPALPEKNAPSRRENDAAAEPAKSSAQVQNGVLQLEKVEVTGSRIRTILGEQTASPMLTWTSEDIDQSGVTNLSDLRNLIPQLSVGSSATFDGNSSGSAPEGRLLFNLRGITGNNTLILVDGRRLPKTGQRGVGESYEATGIPLSAIERVEVLMDGGSAIYGADAIGGVVNLILKKNYTGTELKFDYDNTFDDDASNKHVSLTTSASRGKWSGRIFVSYEEQNALARRDRWWLRSDDRRYIGGTNGTANNFPIGGRVSAVTGLLPGIGAATAYIPTNSNGKNLTIADFLNAPATPNYDAGQYQNALNEFVRASASGHVEYNFRPWARFSADYTFMRNKSYGLDNPVSLSTFNNVAFPQFSTSLPANYPGNPFGVPINVQKYLWELGPLDRRYRMDSYSFTAAVAGILPHDWQYDGSISWTKSTPGTLDQLYQFNTGLLASAMQSATPPIVLNNSLTYGAANPEDTFEALFVTGANREFPQTYTYALNATGPVWNLPAGPLQVAIGSEMREEYIMFDRQTFAASTESAQPNGHRTVTAVYGEISAPLVSPKWKRKIPLVHTLTLGVAGRFDSYNDFGDATKPRYTAQYRPFKWIMLRGSRSEAFKVPLLIEFNRPLSTTNFTVPATGSSSIIDTYRKDEPFTGVIRNTNGGNPNLRPENSVSTNYGIIIESPFKLLQGLSFSVDWWDINIADRVGNLTFQERLLFFPEMFTRDALTPADQAAGYTVGRLAAVDNRSVNIARCRTAGRDYSLRFERRTPWGDFSLKGGLTETTTVESRTKPGGPLSASFSAVTRPKRSVNTLTWSKWGLGASATAIWQDSFRTSATSTVSYPSTIQWNGNLWYDFGTGKLHNRKGWMGHWLKDTRLSAGLINALNIEPALSPTGATAGSIDARLRRYTLTLRKRF